MKINVICKGGPHNHDGREYYGIDPEESGYLMFQGTFGKPNAWYKINRDAPTHQGEHGVVHEAVYVGTHPA